MDVVLKQDVAGLGKAGDLVKVKDGYARNYLIPRGLAVPATEGALRQRRTLKDAQQKKELRIKAEAEKHADKLRGKTLVFHAKTGNGRIFGSITSQDIAKKIQSEFKIPVDKRRVLLSENLKQLGAHTVEIQLHPEVRVEVIIDIQPEGGQ
ncbi:MAG TPA: 50S ribosomal protein L9 [Firmicutes bacterium]|jgi:large subunit ribosomal protein L9|nr:50S ribosomal protein L9 [Bacillota bacterium]